MIFLFSYLQLETAAVLQCCHTADTFFGCTVSWWKICVISWRIPIMNR